MKINSVDKVNYGAGNVVLKRINEDSLSSYKAIKKFAENRKLDVFISKGHEIETLPSHDSYIVVVQKERPIVKKMLIPRGIEKVQCEEFMAIDKKTDDKELSVRIFNATMNAIEALENKLKRNK